MYKIPITLKVLTPVIFSEKSGDALLTATREYFSGSSLRGLFALEYIKQNKLGKDAHLDHNFARYFLSNTLCFTPAYIAKEIDGQYTHATILPLSLQKAKQDGRINDLRVSEAKPGYKSWKGYAFIDSNNAVELATVSRQIEFHISRQSAAERIVGSSKDGNLYKYESISPHQVFQGFIQGSQQDLTDFYQQVLSKLGFNSGVRKVSLGKSRNTQYGLCELSLGLPTPVELPALTNSNSIWLHCQSPYIPLQYNYSDSLIHELQERTGISDLEIRRSFAAASTIEGFVSIWSLKKPRKTQIDAGSIFELVKASPWTEQELQLLNTLIHAGIGESRVEGFGQLRIWTLDNLQIKAENAQQKPAKPARELTLPTKKIMCEIITKRLLEAVRLKAYEARENKGFTKKKNLIARLENCLLRAAGSKEKFEKIINNEISQGTPAEKTLEAIKLKGNISLLEVLKGAAYDIFNIDRHLDKDTIALAQEIGYDLEDMITKNLVFIEYWRWFLRHSRKASEQGGLENE